MFSTIAGRKNIMRHSMKVAFFSLITWHDCMSRLTDILNCKAGTGFKNLVDQNYGCPFSDIDLVAALTG